MILFDQVYMFLYVPYIFVTLLFILIVIMANLNSLWSRAFEDEWNTLEDPQLLESRRTETITALRLHLLVVDFQWFDNSEINENKKSAILLAFWNRLSDLTYSSDMDLVLQRTKNYLKIKSRNKTEGEDLDKRIMDQELNIDAIDDDMDSIFNLQKDNDSLENKEEEILRARSVISSIPDQKWEIRKILFKEMPLNISKESKKMLDLGWLNNISCAIMTNKDWWSYVQINGLLWPERLSYFLTTEEVNSLKSIDFETNDPVRRLGSGVRVSAPVQSILARVSTEFDKEVKLALWKLSRDQ